MRSQARCARWVAKVGDHAVTDLVLSAVGRRDWRTMCSREWQAVHNAIALANLSFMSSSLANGWGATRQMYQFVVGIACASG